MISKSYLLESNINQIDKNLILFYGENLGLKNSETIRKVILPAAIPGISGSLLLAASRAIGETMIVVMAAGLAANLTANPLEAVTTIRPVSLLINESFLANNK